MSDEDVTLDEFEDITIAPKGGHKRGDTSHRTLGTKSEVTGQPSSLEDQLRQLADRLGFDLTPSNSVRGAGNAPWYQCWDPEGDVGGPTGHPPFQSSARTDLGQHVECPECKRRTVMPLEGKALEMAMSGGEHAA